MIENEIIWYKFKMINVSNFSKFWQSVFHFIWVLACVAIAAILAYITAGITNGTIQLGIFTPFIGLALSEIDSWFVQYEKTVVPQ